MSWNLLFKKIFCNETLKVQMAKVESSAANRN